jgi:hypothetical protein
LLIFLCTTASALQIDLDFPSGRFREDSPPTFFKWNLYGESASLALKIFRKDSDGTYDMVRNQVARFDILAEQKSLTWPYEPLTRGEYVWTIEGYDRQNAKPLFKEEMEFIIEPFFDLDLRTDRYGLLMGFSRGNYYSKDNTYSLDYQTTPTVYGFTVNLGEEDYFWDIWLAISDFTVKGSVKRNIALQSAYSFRLNDPNAANFDFFLGPVLKVMNYPRVTSPNSVDIETELVTQLSPGILMSMQKKFGFKVTGYTQFQVDAPVAASSKIKTGDSVSYGTNIGIIFGQMWPLSFGGELQYRIDNSVTEVNSEEIKIKMISYGLVGQVAYTF